MFPNQYWPNQTRTQCHTSKALVWLVWTPICDASVHISMWVMSVCDLTCHGLYDRHVSGQQGTRLEVQLQSHQMIDNDRLEAILHKDGTKSHGCGWKVSGLHLQNHIHECARVYFGNIHEYNLALRVKHYCIVCIIITSSGSIGQWCRCRVTTRLIMIVSSIDRIAQILYTVIQFGGLVW